MEFNTRAGIRTVKDGRWRWLLQSQGYVFRSNPYVKFRKTVNKTNSYFAKKKFYLTVLRESTGITEVLCAIQVSVRIETCECLISASIRTEIPFLKLSENCFFFCLIYETKKAVNKNPSQRIIMCPCATALIKCIAFLNTQTKSAIKCINIFDTPNIAFCLLLKKFIIDKMHRKIN